jgi:hypothetical protein
VRTGELDQSLTEILKVKSNLMALKKQIEASANEPTLRREMDVKKITYLDTAKNNLTFGIYPIKRRRP